MKKVIVVLLILAAISIAYMNRPSGIGEIVDIRLGEANDGRSFNHLILVEGVGEYDKLYISLLENPFDNPIIIGPTGRRFDAEELEIGQKVMYWLTDGRLHMDPPIASYSRLWIIRK